MPKIDTSTIQGFADMTAEDKLNAVLNLEIPGSDDGELSKLKAALTKANTEAANYKRQMTERMTADEKAKAERDEQDASVKQELETLRRANTVYQNTAKALKMGYSPENAEAFANAVADGDTDAMYKVISAQREADKAALTAELAKNAPKPEGNSGGNTENQDVVFAANLGKAKSESAKIQANVLENFMK